MTVIVAAIVGFLTGRMLWLAMRKSWSRQPLMRTNYQGVSLPTAAGIVVSLSLLLVEAGRQILGALGAGDNPGLTGIRAGALVAVFAFSLLGLLDDLVGTSGSRGFAGHARALARGELTSGTVKAIGGGAASLVAAGLILETSANHNFIALILDAAIIALAANFFNLLDLRPGRSGKAGIFLFVVIAILAKFDVALVPAAIVVGAVGGLILDDLHERLMLGDTGANALGAAIGFGLATQLSGGQRVLGFVALLLLNLLSEVVSYTKLIDNFGPLRMLDNIGRRRTPTVDVRDFAESRRSDSDESSANRPATPPYSSTRPPKSPFPEDRHAEDHRAGWESPFDGSERSDGVDELFKRTEGNVGDAQDPDGESLPPDTMDLRGYDRDRYLDHDDDADKPTFPGSMPNGTSHRSDRI